MEEADRTMCEKCDFGLRAGTKCRASRSYGCLVALPTDNRAKHEPLT